MSTFQRALGGWAAWRGVCGFPAEDCGPPAFSPAWRAGACWGYPREFPVNAHLRFCDQRLPVP